MPYIKRNIDGEIVALFREPNSDAGIWENLPIEDAEVQNFLSHSDASPSPESPHSLGGVEVTEAIERLDATDRAMIRVIEDLIEILIEKNIITVTDLPEATQEKLLNRKKIRQLLGDLHFAAGLVEDDDDSQSSI